MDQGLRNTLKKGIKGIIQNTPVRKIKNRRMGYSVIISLILTVLLFQGVDMQLISASDGFKDIKTSDWFYQNVSDLVKDSRAIVKGYPDGSFKPQASLTKDQFITMVVRSAGFNLPNSEGYWAQNNIDKAVELHFIYKGEFIDYNQPITREEMSLIITRVVDYLDGIQTYKDLEQVEQVVLDKDTFSKAFREDILKTYKLGIITGYNDNTFRPKGILTRSEASAVLIRVIKPSSRIPFNYDELYYKLYGDINAHLIGGSKWVDPLKATNLKNAQEDWLIIKSELKYFPMQKDFDLGLTNKISIDDVMGSINYNKDGPAVGQITDFENLLKRRISEKSIEKIMYYLSKKKNSITFLEHEEIVIFVDDNKYIISLFEDILFEGMTEKQAVEIQFNIIYRDENFMKNFEHQFTTIYEGKDKIIVR